MSTRSRHRPVRFGVFEVDLTAGEVRKHGIRLKLHEKPFQILLALLEHPGEVVTREELQQRLWPGHTFVEFENGLNNAIRRLREALGDSAESPGLIETLPRRGYRLVASVEPREINSVAVLPLVTMNVAEDSDDEYLAFGMTEALTAELSKVGSLKVISQTSAMQYKDARKSLPEIARELGVDAVVEGSVVRDGNEIRVTVQLIEAATDTHLWAETYQRELRDILNMQTEIAQAIAREIQVTLTPGEQAALNAARPVNPAAHEAYLRGRYFWHRQTDEGVRKALAYFEQAIALDPSYAPAYAGLSDVCREFAAGRALTLSERTKAREKARVAADRALDLDPTLADAHVAKGYFLLHFDWDLEGAEKALRKAIALSPNHAVAHGGLAEYFLARNQPQEALEQAQRAYELSPATVLSNRWLGSFFSYAGDYHRAIAQLQKALEMEPDDAIARANLGLAYLRKGQHKEAMVEFQKAVHASEADWALAALAYAHAVTGDRAEALKILRAVEARGQTPPFVLAIAYAALRDDAKAFAWLQKGCEERDSSLVMIRIMPQLAPFRSDPRFQALLRKMNFAPVHGAPQ